MESILFLGGLAPAIGMRGGEEPGGDGTRTGETRGVFMVEGKSAGKLPKFKLLGAPAYGVIEK
jgi:hypothetical protein